MCFPKGINKNINVFIKEVRPDGVNLDYDVNLHDLNLNNAVVFQGGLNPKFLLGSQQKMFKEAKRYLDFFKDRPYIFNLGHGILPQTKPENVKIKSEEEIIKYSYYVAGTVGAMMAHIFNTTNPKAIKHAIDLGIAMQLTNIGYLIVNGKYLIPSLPLL